MKYKKNLYCKGCLKDFEIGDSIIVFDDIPFCDADCLYDYLEEKNRAYLDDVIK